MRTLGNRTWLTVACGTLLSTAAWSQEVPIEQLKPVPGRFGGTIVVPQSPQFDNLRGFDFRAEAREIQIGGDKGKVQGDDVVPLGEYWIGVASQDADATLRAQLDLPDGVGLVVMRVMDDSPAKKAGLQEQDVLVKAGETDLKSLSDLVAAVQAAGEKELVLKFVRKGKAQQISILPHKRKVESTLQVDAPAEASREWQMRLPYYVIVTEPRGPLDLKIAITRKKDEKANILVERDQVKYQVVEGHLEDLPPDLRAIVSSLLSQPRFRVAATKPTPLAPLQSQPGQGQYGFTNPVTPPGMSAPPTLRWGVAATPAGNLESQMKELIAQMNRLLRAIEQQHRQQAAQTTAGVGGVGPAELKPAPASPTDQLRQEIEALRKEVEELKKQKQ